MLARGKTCCLIGNPCGFPFWVFSNFLLAIAHRRQFVRSNQRSTPFYYLRSDNSTAKVINTSHETSGCPPACSFAGRRGGFAECLTGTPLHTEGWEKAILRLFRIVSD